MTDLSSWHLLSGYCDTDMVISMGKLRMGLQNYMKVKIMQLLTWEHRSKTVSGCNKQYL